MLFSRWAIIAFSLICYCKARAASESDELADISDYCDCGESDDDKYESVDSADFVKIDNAMM